MGVCQLDRQKTRKTILLVSFMLLPVTMYYLSPLLILQGASKGVITGSLIFIFLLFFATLWLGRSFCGWLCPAGALQDIASGMNGRVVKTGYPDRVKYFLWGAWLMVLFFLILKAGGFQRVDIFYRIRFGISLTDPSGYLLYYFAMAAILTLSLWLGRRPFCHYLCILAPFMVISRKLSRLMGFHSIQLESHRDKCINCMICNKNCPMSLDVHSMVLEENMFNSECILCGACADSCPRDVISLKWK